MRIQPGKFWGTIWAGVGNYGLKKHGSSTVGDMLLTATMWKATWKDRQKNNNTSCSRKNLYRKVTMQFLIWSSGKYEPNIKCGGTRKTELPTQNINIQPQEARKGWPNYCISGKNAKITTYSRLGLSMECALLVTEGILDAWLELGSWIIVNIDWYL